MERIKNALECVSLLALTFMGLSIGFLCARFLSTLQRVDTVIEQASVTLANASKLEATLQADQVHTQAQIDGAAHEARQSFLELRRTLYTVNTKTLPQLSADSHAVMASSDKLLQDSDRNLSMLSTQTAESIKQFGQDSQSLVAATVKAEEDADKLLADPTMVANLQASSDHLEAGLDHLQQVMASLEVEQRDVQEWTHRITRPASAAKQVLETIGHYAVVFAGAMVGAK